MATEFINQYGVTILYTILTGIFGFVGICIKNLCQKYINDKTKKDVVVTCVKAVEQLYKDLHGPEKYDKAVEGIEEMLAEKGITITDLEIKMLIEASCNEFVKAVKEDTNDSGENITDCTEGDWDEGEPCEQ